MNVSVPFLGGGNPQEDRCKRLVTTGPRPESRMVGRHSLHYAAIAGGAVGHFSFQPFFLPHCGLQLLVSGTTRKMGRRDNQDAVYVASIEGPEFNAVVIAMADGVGSRPGSGLAASAFIQGAHLAAAKSITEPCFREPSRIFLEAAVAFRVQRLKYRRYGYDQANTTGLVIVISQSGIHGTYTGDTIPILHNQGSGWSQARPHNRPDQPNVITASVRDAWEQTSFDGALEQGGLLYAVTDGARALMNDVSEEIRLPSTSTLRYDRKTADALLVKWIEESPTDDKRDNSSLVLVRVDPSKGLRRSRWR